MQLPRDEQRKMKVYEATLQYNKTLFEVSTKVINTPGTRL